MEKQARNNFDGLRLSGALFVLVSHQFALSARPEPVFLGLKLGTIGVLMFFAISGFLVTASWRSDPHAGRFFARRLLRVWPALALCLVVSIAFLVTVLIPAAARSDVPAVVMYLLPNFVFDWRDGIFLPGNPHPYFFGALWTIPIEMQCYVALAVLGIVASARLRLALIIASAVVLGLYLLGVQPAGLLASHGFFQLHDSLNLPVFFLAGALACAVPILQSARACVVMVMLGILCAAFGFAGLAWVLSLPAIVLFVGKMSWPGLRDGARWGDMSYGIYLWAWPVQQIGVAALGPRTPYLVLLSATLAVVVPLSICSWHFVEKRSLRLKPKMRSGAPGSVPSAAVRPMA